MKQDENIIDFNEVIIRNHVEALRPPADLRDQVDISYKFEKNTLEIFSIRPHWQNPKEKTEMPIVKTRFVKTEKRWRIYWMRASGKWEAYEPMASVATIEAFFVVLKEDTHGCFFG